MYIPALYVRLYVIRRYIPYIYIYVYVCTWKARVRVRASEKG